MRLPCLLLACATCFAQSSPSGAPRFQDIGPQSGLTVPNISSKDEYYIVESMSGGAGFIDCDNDGKLDIVTVNGSTVDRYRHGGDLMVTLYHQDSGLKFTDITKSAGLTRKGWGMGVSVADFDNDGWQDLYVTGYGGNVLYRNLGNCKFEDVTEKAGLRVGGFSSGAAWGDYDRDGYVDLFVARYVHEDMDALPVTHADGVPCSYTGMRVYCGPSGLPGDTDFLFHNRGDGTFENVSKKAGVNNDNHFFGMQPVWADFANDGWLDLYVANDVNPNYQYRNKHDGTFEEVGLLTGTAVNSDGQMQGSMGVDIADFDHDGKMDILVTNYIQEGVDLYWNRGEQGFDQISASAGLLQATRRYVGWGGGFFDMDNDGWLDILITNGHIYPQVDSVTGSVTFRQPLLLFRNRRDRTFEDVTVLSKLNAGDLYVRRGAAFGDVNNDGKVDVLILNHNGTPSVLINRTETENHAALFKLVGTKSNKVAIGARATVTAGGMTQFLQVRSGSSYLSQNDLRLHFGLGASAVMEKVEVSWPSGAKEVLKDVPAGFIYTVVEGSGIQGKTALNR
ncbi:MAG TPA: CRTAC1 family protein [Candidatus Sulfotelmatobacter sp.]|nr:CRTAC1 family protein [Candidatus Sulfotelmatobacter sp.]